jgi:hypothetical protein
MSRSPVRVSEPPRPRTQATAARLAPPDPRKVPYTECGTFRTHRSHPYARGSLTGRPPLPLRYTTRAPGSLPVARLVWTRRRRLPSMHPRCRKSRIAALAVRPLRVLLAGGSSSAAAVRVAPLFSRESESAPPRCTQLLLPRERSSPGGSSGCLVPGTTRSPAIGIRESSPRTTANLLTESVPRGHLGERPQSRAAATFFDVRRE